MLPVRMTSTSAWVRVDIKMALADFSARAMDQVDPKEFLVSLSKNAGGIGLNDPRGMGASHH